MDLLSPNGRGIGCKSGEFLTNIDRWFLEYFNVGTI